ncbi:MAG: gliding motility lipoprotein GldH [Prevotella sp.]|nr:gliding motility lipoprotein GldH [Prevotella sp.]
MGRRASNRLRLIGIMAAVVITSCQRRTLYHNFEHTPLSGWERNDTLLFTTPPASEGAVLQREIELRISQKYPFQRVNLIVEQLTLPSNIVRRDTVNCSLVDQKGNFLGEGITLFQYRFRLPDATVDKGDSLTISIRHNMKRETLPGMADIGLRLTAQ